MHIESNIQSVIAQVERLKANIPVAMQRALAPEKWEQAALRLAVDILLAIAKPNERQFIQDFAESLVVAVGPEGGLMLKMRSPMPAQENLTTEMARAARGTTDTRDRGLGLFQKQVSSFEDMILEWVQSPEGDGGKRKDKRDWGMSDEDIADKISYLLLSPKVKPGTKEMAARNALMPHIEEFLRLRQAANSLPPETVDLWLRAVLAGWRDLVRIKYPEFVRSELRKL